MIFIMHIIAFFVDILEEIRLFQLGGKKVQLNEYETDPCFL